MPRVFKSLPSFDGIRKVNSTDFFNALESCGLHIIKEDGTLISRFIDKDGTNMLDYEDFLFALRGKPNQQRQACIDYQVQTTVTKKVKKIFYLILLLLNIGMG